MKKLLLLLLILANTSYAQMGGGGMGGGLGLTISQCYHNGELYKVVMNVGTTPGDCPDYVEGGPIIGYHTDKVNDDQTDFIRNANDPHNCSFGKDNRFEDPSL